MLGIIDEVPSNPHHSREKILLASAKLFATNGYDAVSVRDIGDAVGLNSGSIYSHYTSKEEILNCVLDRCDTLFGLYYTRLEESCREADTIEQIIENLFQELRQVYTTFTYYGVSIMYAEQLRNEKAREIYFRHMPIGGRDRIKRILDRAVERRLVGPFDTLSLSTLLIGTVVMNNNLRVMENEGVVAAFHLDEDYKHLCQFFLRAAKHGI